MMYYASARRNDHAIACAMVKIPGWSLAIIYYASGRVVHGEAVEKPNGLGHRSVAYDRRNNAKA